MKTILLSAAIAVSLSTAAYAGSLYELPTTVSAVSTIAESDWAGFYAGGTVGHDVVTAVFPIDTADYDLGVFAGYRAAVGDFVVGAEGALSDPLGSADETTLEATLGFDAGAFLPYLSAGYGWSTAGDGIVYGLGVDFALTDDLFIGGKYATGDLGDGVSFRVGLTF